THRTGRPGGEPEPHPEPPRHRQPRRRRAHRCDIARARLQRRRHRRAERAQGGVISSLPSGLSSRQPNGYVDGLMTITALDTHQTVKDLTAAGFSDAQAEALAHVLREVQQIDLSELATKADVAGSIADVRREMAEMKAELVKWVVGVGFAQVATILAVLK